MRVQIILLFLLAGLAAAAQQTSPSSGNAQIAPPPAGPLCNADVEGQLSCQANRVCECVHSTAVPARGLPARWHWDCDITRPQCTVTPESLAPHHPAPPYIVEVERGSPEDPLDREKDVPPPPW